MVIVDMERDAWPAERTGELSEPRRVSVVDDDQARDPVNIDVPEPFDLDSICRGLDEEIPHALFLGAGKDQRCVGVKLLSRDHGGQCVEICVRMAGDYFHIQVRLVTFGLRLGISSITDMLPRFAVNLIIGMIETNILTVRDDRIAISSPILKRHLF